MVSAPSQSASSADDADCDGALTTDDCDDGDAARYPGAADRSVDGVDQNCDGVDGVPEVDCTATSVLKGDLSWPAQITLQHTRRSAVYLRDTIHPVTVLIHSVHAAICCAGIAGSVPIIAVVRGQRPIAVCIIGR